MKSHIGCMGEETPLMVRVAMLFNVVVKVTEANTLRFEIELSVINLLQSIETPFLRLVFSVLFLLFK